MSHASYVSGTSTVPLIGETIGAHFDRAVARWGAREGLVVRHQDVHWTYRELADRVDALAGGLLALGLEPGDRIGIWSPNRAEWVQLQFASAKAGLILVNINPTIWACCASWRPNWRRPSRAGFGRSACPTCASSSISIRSSSRAC